ncbi:MAG: hypothetical protein LBB45_02530 [Methanobrevibacter sp.]|nr:hypothetical protein [Candidatus Methanovirga basalitermitum]
MVYILEDKEKLGKIVKSCLLEINGLKLDLAKVQNENIFLKDEKNIGRLKDLIKSRDDAISKLKNLLNESNKIISDKQSIINEKNNRIHELKNFQSSFNEIEDKIKKNIKQFKSEELKKNNLDLKETLTIILEKDKLINEYLNEIEEYKVEISRLEDNHCNEKFLDIQKELESKNKIIENLSSEINKNKKAIKKYKTELDDYRFKIKECNSKIEGYQSDNEEFNSKVKELHALINMKNIELDGVKDKILSYENRINSLKEEVGSSNKIISQKDKEIIDLEKKVGINENKLEFFEKESGSLRNSLKESIDYKQKINDLSKEIDEKNSKIQRLEQLKTLLKEFDLDYNNDEDKSDDFKLKDGLTGT